MYEYMHIYTHMYVCIYVCIHTYVFILFLQEFSYYSLALQSLRCKEESRAIETQLFGS